ncbi:hypothetical protein N7453_003917 [Penicillium expansum]|nr:hypothetical protein N7453_003917 [Penicillium expansum]
MVDLGKEGRNYFGHSRKEQLHSWVDLEDIDDEEELDDAESDVEKQLSPKKKHVDSWVDRIE